MCVRRSARAAPHRARVPAARRPSPAPPRCCAARGGAWHMPRGEDVAAESEPRAGLLRLMGRETAKEAG